MTAANARRLKRTCAARAGLALGIAAASICVANADGTIYRCLGADGRVTFTDQACADGDRIDVRAGRADPAAITQLKLEQEAFDRREAKRRAERREVELRRLEIEALRRQDAAARYLSDPIADTGCLYCGGYAWYAPWIPPAPVSRPPPARPLPAPQPAYLDFGIRR